jgi:hypothetical protein
MEVGDTGGRVLRICDKAGPFLWIVLPFRRESGSCFDFEAGTQEFSRFYRDYVVTCVELGSN